MGGLAFAGKTMPVELKYVDHTLNHFFYKHMFPIGVKDFAKIGSTGKKEISSDLDIAIHLGDLSKSDIKNHLASTLGNSSVKLVGNNIGVCYEIRDESSAIGGYTQIDIMLTNNLEDASWLMTGTGQGVKGVYRNLLLSFITKLKCHESLEFSIGFPGGLLISSIVKNKNSTRITNPQHILDYLENKCSPREAESFQYLSNVLVRDEKFKNQSNLEKIGYKF